MEGPQSVESVFMACLERRRQRRRAGELPKPIPALVIARWANVRPTGSDDSRKRGVRTIIDRMRTDGAEILASFGGYYLASEPADLVEYQAWRKRMGLAHLVGARELSKLPVMDAIAGQMQFGS